VARALTTPEATLRATAIAPSRSGEVRRSLAPAAGMLGLAWFAPQSAAPVLLGVLIVAALRAIVEPLADHARLPQRIGGLLVLGAALLGAALGAWAEQLPLTP
jgi:hypothetical protein